MPELPEVEIVRQSLDKKIQKKRSKKKKNELQRKTLKDKCDRSDRFRKTSVIVVINLELKASVIDVVVIDLKNNKRKKSLKENFER